MIKSHLKQSCDKQNLTLVVISYENMELTEGSYNKLIRDDDEYKILYLSEYLTACLS